MNPGLNLPIAFVMDERLSKDKMGQLVQTLKFLKNHLDLEIISENEATEANILKKLEKNQYSLLLCPLPYYENWAKIEGHYGLNRVSGPTWAGYFSDTLLIHKLPSFSYPMHKTILDFAHLEASEILLLIQALKNEKNRSGIRPLLQPQTLIHCESWYSNQPQGQRLDFILNLPEIQQAGWMKRANSIRILLSALWSLIYEEGPAQPSYNPTQSTEARASFQFAADTGCLALKLYYTYPKHSHPSTVLQLFSPPAKLPATHPIQLLLQYADFVRIHTIKDTADIELTVGLFPSAPAEKFFQEARTLWISPLSSRLISEQPYETPSPQNPRLHAIAPTSPQKPRLAVSQQLSSESSESPSLSSPLNSPFAPLLVSASEKIKELKMIIHEKDENIQELRTGGVGEKVDLTPPNAEELLEAFQNRFFDAQFQIRECENQIQELEKDSSKKNLETIKDLKQKIEALINREKSWIKKLILIVGEYKKQSSIQPKNKK